MRWWIFSSFGIENIPINHKRQYFSFFYSHLFKTLSILFNFNLCLFLAYFSGYFFSLSFSILPYTLQSSTSVYLHFIYYIDYLSCKLSFLFIKLGDIFYLAQIYCIHFSNFFVFIDIIFNIIFNIIESFRECFSNFNI